MKVKRLFWTCVTIILFLTTNFSAKAYTRKDLEKIQKFVEITDLVFAIPFLVSENPSNAHLSLMIPTFVLDCSLHAALESSTLISLATNLARLLKITLTPNLAEKLGLQHPFLPFILAGISYVIIMKVCSSDKKRTKRRILRALVPCVINALFFLVETTERKHNPRKYNIFLEEISLLIMSIVVEGIGEKIICGATE